MNYIQYPSQQQYGGVPRPAYTQTGGWNNRIRPVSSIEEVKAASIDFDGSVFYFADVANRRIYTKQINLDGTVTINLYEQKELNQTDQMSNSSYVTKQEFETAINQLKGMYEQLSKPIVEDIQAPAAQPKPSFNI